MYILYRNSLIRFQGGKVICGKKRIYLVGRRFPVLARIQAAFRSGLGVISTQVIKHNTEPRIYTTAE